MAFHPKAIAVFIAACSVSTSSAFTPASNSAKATRNNEKVQQYLAIIKADAEADNNLMPSIIAAVKEYATVGEIVKVMKDVYGEFEEPIFF